MSELPTFVDMPTQEGALPGTFNGSHHESRFLLPHIVDIAQYKKPQPRSAGTFFFDRYELSNGIVHHVSTGIPHKLQVSTPIDSTTAWFTQPEGHNSITDNKLMELGFYTRRIGPERIPIVNPLDQDERNESIRLAQQLDFMHIAHNILSILREADNRRSYGIDKGNSLYTGESRAAMIEPALQILSSKYDRKFHHSDTIDPCIAKRADFSDIPKMAKITASELEAIGRTAIHILKHAERKTFIDTIDVSPESFLPAVMAAGYLLNGQAGELARIRPGDCGPAHITMMRRSYANDHLHYADIYSTKPNVVIKMEGGGHMDIPKSRQNVVQRHDAIKSYFIDNDGDLSGLSNDDVKAGIYKLGTKRRHLWAIPNLLHF